MIGLTLAIGLPARAEVRPKGAITPLEIDEIGLLIVKVRLSSKKAGIPDRDFRFIFDTGATFNVVDYSVPTDFFWDEPEKPKGASSTVGDATGQRIAARNVSLKHLEFAGMVREDSMAIRLDLKGTMLGRIQDEPVDGILGMNFLRGTRLVLDPIAREVRWWQDIPGHRIPLAYSESDHPTLTVKFAGTEVPCSLDTGGTGGFQMTGQADESDHPEPYFYSGASGEVRQGQTVKVERLEAGGKAWVKVPLDLVKPGEGGANLGRDILFAAPLGLDFIDQWATFTLDAQGNLPFRKAPARPPLFWDRRPEGNRLCVATVNPISRWAKAGALEGDEVLAIGPLTGNALTLRSATALSSHAEAQTWRVRRDGIERVFDVPAGQ